MYRLHPSDSVQSFCLLQTKPMPCATASLFPISPTQDDDESDDSVEENDNLKSVRKSQEEQLVLENIRNGDFSSLEADWDAFQIKASNPNDDDDDDDDDEDDDEEEEEEGEEEEGEEGGVSVCAYFQRKCFVFT